VTTRRKGPSKGRPHQEAEQPVPEGAASSRPVWAAILILVVAVVAAYANSLHGPFIFDDEPSIESNPSIRSLAFPQVLLAPPEAVTVTGRPLVNLSLAINYAVGGLAVEGYHLVNLALHLLATLALFALVRRTLLLPGLAERFRSSATGLALGVALLWAIHPLQTESVTYVVQRAEVMVGLFFFLTLYTFLRSTSAPSSGPWTVATVGACALGMASKEVMATAPLMVFLFDRCFVAGSFKESLRRRWRLWLGLAATWVLVPLLYHLSGNRGRSAGFGLGMSAWQYARTQFGCIVHYLRLTFWPDPLVLDYGQGIANSAAEIVPYALVVLALLALTVVALVVRPKWGFLGAWFFVILAPSSSIVPLATQTEAEHRMYLPLAAVVAALAIAFYAKLGRFRWAAVLVVVLAVALGWRTHARNIDYQSEMAIWEGNIREVPSNDRGYLTRASLFWSMGRFDAALEDYDRCLSLNPRNAKAYLGRGNVHSDQGERAQALQDYETALTLDAKLADAYDGRGGVLLAQGQIDRAMQDFETALSLDPLLANAYLNRAHVHDARRELDLAIRDYTMVIKLRPDFALAYSNRCSALASRGEFEAALEDCDRAITLRPDLAGAYSNRGRTLQTRGRFADAIRDYDQAIALRPDLVAAYQNRAIAHMQIGAYDKAWADVQSIRKLGQTPNPVFVEDLKKKSGRSE
jgi:tetratricopeptide (TPR) repeat protein